MEIQRFHIQNLGRFESLEASLAPTEEFSSKVTVFVGNNGAGKTSVLRSLATSLSWFVARLRSEKGSGSPIPQEAVLNGKAGASIDLDVLDENCSGVNSNAEIADPLHQWSLTKGRMGRKVVRRSQLAGASRLADCYRTLLLIDEKCSLPLIAFYPVERIVLDIPLRIKERHSFLQLDGYDNALNQGVDFRRFFEWFREREDAENETGMPPELLDKLLSSIDRSSDAWKTLNQHMASSRDRQLAAVRSAISRFMPGFTNLRVRRKPRLHMSIDKDGKTLNVVQLSQGEKSMMALVGDIARRLAMMNPALENPLHGEGIILIDEVDMHLHPSWQRSIIDRLTTTFPACQFILTTHSPLVISECKGVLVYSLDDGELAQVPSQYGQDANSVLLDVMHTPIRNSHISERIGDLLDHIQNRDFAQAKAIMHDLEHELPASSIELTKARFLLRKQELRSEKD